MTLKCIGSGSKGGGLMFIRCAGSSSNGNSYALYSDNGQILLLDAGLPIKEIKKMCDFNDTDIVGCVVSHGHT